jgi:hypothetical protein
VKRTYVIALARFVAEVAERPDPLIVDSVKDRFDRLGESFEPVDTGQKDVLDPAVLEFVTVRVALESLVR